MAALARVIGRVTDVAHTTVREIWGWRIARIPNFPSATSSPTAPGEMIVQASPASTAFLMLGNESISAITFKDKPCRAQASSMIRLRLLNAAPDMDTQQAPLVGRN